jgi:hypothetical protein
MSVYLERVANNILPLSLSGELVDAFREWYFTDNTHDHEKPVENCELCNQEQLRYHFEIHNRLTHKKLWVGSSCILKFDVAVLENGVVLDKRNTELKLNSLMNKMRLESCINALMKLAASESNNILNNALAYYLKNKYLTPKFAFVVFWKLKENQIDHHPSFFKIGLRRAKYKNDLKNMPLERVHLIWAGLTSSQRKIAIDFGHTEPKEQSQ